MISHLNEEWRGPPLFVRKFGGAGGDGNLFICVSVSPERNGRGMKKAFPRMAGNKSSRSNIALRRHS
ncbi:hypothetical protein D6764_01290 [Candidatus Woesearchaeota archaeon]|nr:MAG: hypothetical protein D6764_01290 [Candidatus Woesearchaeota archaeon]